MDAGPSGSEVYGSFNITLVPPFEETMSPATTSVLGKVNDGPAPIAEAWKLEREAEGCRLYTPRILFCDPPCGSAGVCVRDDECAPHPQSTEVGTVTLKGVGATPIAMDVIAGNYQPKAGTSLPYPPCREGESVMLEAAGGTHPAFQISARCIAPLEFSGSVPYRRGEPLRLKWNAAGSGSDSTITVKVDLSHHGGSKGKIECEVADDGAHDIPAALADALVELGVAGFPTVALTRSSTAAGSGAASGVALTIAASQERPIEIPGLTSCSEDTDCASGQTCQTDRSCK
ncbi:MAG TPA: hypothetical protein VJR89_03620 [Polyangiales bacterium]|nr:hypothetical protein [Polyangiales bacterium]